MFTWSFLVLLGNASVKTIYSYLGYYNVCHLGSEIRNPGRNIPRSIFISIICIDHPYYAKIHRQVEDGNTNDGDKDASGNISCRGS